MSIGDVCSKVTSGGTPSTSHKDYYDGEIPWLRTQEVDWCDIYDTGVKITQKGLENSSAKWISENCVIVAMYGATAAKVGINKIPLTTNQACCNLEINKDIAEYKYVYYWLCNEYENLKALGQGSQSNINAQIIKNYPILVPSLEKQQKIVDILDRFSSLAESMENGIPAEIEANRKRYEYYRDELLNLKEIA
jgi:type I restriction enzyme S subunit